MTRESVHEHLLRLKEVILTEREHAKKLDLPSLLAIMREKEALIQVLNRVDTLPPEDQQVAREIKEENRRNAYLFKSTLNWIQDTMLFFGRKTTPATYGHSGATYAVPVNGRLLSGRI